MNIIMFFIGFVIGIGMTLIGLRVFAADIRKELMRDERQYGEGELDK